MNEQCAPLRVLARLCSEGIGVESLFAGQGTAAPPDKLGREMFYSIHVEVLAEPMQLALALIIGV